MGRGQSTHRESLPTGRATASPTPSPALPELQWSATLANNAATWVNTCTFGYDPALTNQGQNILVSTKALQIETVVQNWSNQKSNYN